MRIMCCAWKKRSALLSLSVDEPDAHRRLDPAVDDLRLHARNNLVDAEVEDVGHLVTCD